MRITVIAPGKIKEKFYTQAIAEYAKRLSAYCKLDIVEVADEPTSENASPAMEIKVKEKEGERILSKIRDSSYVIALAIDGKSWDSVSLSRHLETLQIGGKSDMTFVIGGSLGLSDQVLARANEKLSFSAMTFPHQLMRVILLEQLYRCYRIQRGEPYHK